MGGGGYFPVKKDDIPDSIKRKQSPVLKSAMKALLTGKLPYCGNGSSSSGNSSEVAPQKANFTGKLPSNSKGSSSSGNSSKVAPQ